MAAIKRRDSLRVNLSPDLKDRIDRLSSLLGLPPSTLAALAVGHWVANQERALGVVDRVADAITSQLGDGLADQLKQIGLFSKGNTEM